MHYSNKCLCRSNKSYCH